MILRAALDGFEAAYLPHTQVQEHLDRGDLVWLLEAWSPLFPGYHLYFSNRRQTAPAFALLVEALRHRE